VAEYPQTPPGWTAVARTKVGPFTTHVTFRRPDGRLAEWSSRLQRKRASLVSRAHLGEGVWWAPRRAAWWIGVLFAIGSTCFLIAPFPGYEQLVGSAVDGVTFFIGSIFFTSAAALQFIEAANADRGPDGHGRRALQLLSLEPRRIDWWSSIIQLVGTLYFNVDTFRAMQTAFDSSSYNQLVWKPDTIGSACFLISGYLAYVEVGGSLFSRPRKTLESRIASINLLGCIAFGVSAIAAFQLPSSGSIWHLAASNFTTAFGALCFLIGAVLLLPESAAAESEAETDLGEVPEAPGGPQG
jgi:hypothetical protein